MEVSNSEIAFQRVQVVDQLTNQDLIDTMAQFSKKGIRAAAIACGSMFGNRERADDYVRIAKLYSGSMLICGVTHDARRLEDESVPAVSYEQAVLTEKTMQTLERTYAMQLQTQISFPLTPEGQFNSAINHWRTAVRMLREEPNDEFTLFQERAAYQTARTLYNRCGSRATIRDLEDRAYGLIQPPPTDFQQTYYDWLEFDDADGWETLICKVALWMLTFAFVIPWGIWDYLCNRSIAPILVHDDLSIE